MIIYVHIYILGILVIYIYENCILYIYIYVYHYMCLKPEDQFYWRLEHQGTRAGLESEVNVALLSSHHVSAYKASMLLRVLEDLSRYYLQDNLT